MTSRIEYLQKRIEQLEAEIESDRRTLAAKNEADRDLMILVEPAMNRIAQRVALNSEELEACAREAALLKDIQAAFPLPLIYGDWQETESRHPEVIIRCRVQRVVLPSPFYSRLPSNPVGAAWSRETYYKPAQIETSEVGITFGYTPDFIAGSAVNPARAIADRLVHGYLSHNPELSRFVSAVQWANRLLGVLEGAYQQGRHWPDDPIRQMITDLFGHSEVYLQRRFNDLRGDAWMVEQILAKTDYLKSFADAAKAGADWPLVRDLIAYAIINRPWKIDWNPLELRNPEPAQ